MPKLLNRAYPVIISSFATGMIAGCSVFSAKEASLTDYDQARRSINNPVDVAGSNYRDGEFRPEGVTAESKGGRPDFLQRIGLKSKTRKDVDLARSQFEQADARFLEAREMDAKPRVEAFREAAELYKNAAGNWRSSSLEQDALLMAAESHFFAEDYYEAEQLYAQLVKEYPRNPYLDHVDGRRFEIGDFWLKSHAVNPRPFVVVNFTDPKYPWNDTGNHGKRVLEKMRLSNPTGKVSDDATMRLAVAKFQSGDFEAAADAFADLRVTYPDSEHQFQAQYLELQSLIASYQGPAYSGVPIEEAEKRVKQIVKIFPGEASERNAELNEAYAKIRFFQAERKWKRAEDRRKRLEHDSARFYYHQILEQYAETPFAQRAEQRLEELAGKPGDPPQRLQWLVKVMGANNDDRPWEQFDHAEE